MVPMAGTLGCPWGTVQKTCPSYLEHSVQEARGALVPGEL